MFLFILPEDVVSQDELSQIKLFFFNVFHCLSLKLDVGHWPLNTDSVSTRKISGYDNLTTYRRNAKQPTNRLLLSIRTVSKISSTYMLSKGRQSIFLGICRQILSNVFHLCGVSFFWVGGVLTGIHHQSFRLFMWC